MNATLVQKLAEHHQLKLRVVGKPRVCGAFLFRFVFFHCLLPFLGERLEQVQDMEAAYYRYMTAVIGNSRSLSHLALNLYPHV